MEIPERLRLAEAAEEGQGDADRVPWRIQGAWARLITPLGFYQRGDHLFMRAFATSTSRQVLSMRSHRLARRSALHGDDRHTSAQF